VAWLKFAGWRGLTRRGNHDPSIGICFIFGYSVMVGSASQIQAMAPELTHFLIYKNLLFCARDCVTLIRRGTLEKYETL
jgi:hypothetical protein